MIVANHRQPLPTAQAAFAGKPVAPVGAPLCSERKGLVSVEVKKKKGQYDMKLLAVDIPMVSGPDQRLLLIGDEERVQRIVDFDFTNGGMEFWHDISNFRVEETTFNSGGIHGKDVEVFFLLATQNHHEWSTPNVMAWRLQKAKKESQTENFAWIASNDLLREKRHLLTRIESHKQDLTRPRTKWRKLANQSVLRMR
ncbi:unnamed protein product [Brassica rapa]|uniref:Uncharacterized protein n=1 Tax=Brassica campestris TaxID=3711 RepID=A0A3P6CJH1_BRACM|nr:unnamed protein product [Brassica rapa]VDD15686.1 unnamed protein product [Brassica rapa]